MGREPRYRLPSPHLSPVDEAPSGCRFFSIDHRSTESIENLRGEWIGIRPGTDGALALGLIHVVIKEKLYHHEFVQNWTRGFSELSQYVSDFTPERCQQITGVDSEAIEQLARLVAAKRSCYLANTGLEYNNSGVQAARAILVLFALTGNLDSVGGNVISMQRKPPTEDTFRHSPPPTPKPVGSTEYPVFYKYRKQAHALEIPRAILKGEPYPLEALLVFGCSVLTAYPNPALWKRCFKRLKLLVSVDRQLTADSAYADIVLPAATLFETESYVVHDHTLYDRPQMIQPFGEAKPDWEIIVTLAQRLGLKDYFPQTVAQARKTLSPERQPEEQLYEKWNSGRLRDDGKPGFPTPSGLFEIASNILEEHHYDGLPKYTEPLESPTSSPGLAADYPLVFNSGARRIWDFRSQFHNVEGLVKRQPEPIVQLHSEDAKSRGINTGDRVIVQSPRGRVAYTALVTDSIVPGVVEANFGGGGVSGPVEWQECNVNELTDHDNRDPISGFPVYKALLCEVVKAST